MSKNSTRKKRITRKRKKSIILIIISIISIVLISSILIKNFKAKKDEEQKASQFGDIENQVAEKQETDELGHIVQEESSASLHVIDLGLSNAILVKSNNTEVLIDAGDAEHSDELVKYLRSNVSGAIEYVVVTNYYKDLTGGLSKVYENFAVKNTIIGNLPQKEKPENITSFDKFVSAASNQTNNNIDYANNQNIDIGNGISITVYKGVNSDVNQDSNSSICLISYKSYDNSRILYCSDASQELIQKFGDIFSDIGILILPNHGNSSSMPTQLLSSWEPDMIIVSSSKPEDNGGRYPDNKMIKLLENSGIASYSTYRAGTIVINLLDGGSTYFDAPKITDKIEQEEQTEILKNENSTDSNNTGQLPIP